MVMVFVESEGFVFLIKSGSEGQICDIECKLRSAVGKREILRLF